MKHPTIIIAAFLLGALILHTLAAPAAEPEEIFDQRQNGTENYRINVDGLFFAVAPAEALIEAASASDLDELLSLTDFQEIAAILGQPSNSTKPSNPPSSSQSPQKPSEAISPKKRSGIKLKLGHLLLPLLKRTNQQ